LRHVTLATNLLAAVEPWSTEENAKLRTQLLFSLWKAMASSFIAKSNCTTVFQANENQLGSRVCHHSLQLAERVLALPAGYTDRYETSLTLTFLRGLEYPDQLMAAGPVWICIHEHAHHRPNLKRSLQAAVLTLRQQHQLSSSSSAHTGSCQQHQEILDRLIPMLLRPPEGHSLAAQGERLDDPWDGFFLRQLGPAMGDSRE
jgi:hypothetical protein